MSKKAARGWSSDLAMKVAEHPSESFAPFDCGMKSAKGRQRLQQPILEPSSADTRSCPVDGG